MITSSATPRVGADDARTDVLRLPGRPDRGAVAAGVARPGRPGLRWGWLVIGLLAAVLAVTGVASFAAAHATMAVQGTVAVYGYGMSTPGSACSQPMALGMPVTVYDASGSLVGTTTLTGSGVSRDTWSTYSSSSYADSCEYTFSVPDVTTASSFYRVKVGSGENDGVGYSLDQLRGGPIATTLR